MSPEVTGTGHGIASHEWRLEYNSLPVDMTNLNDIYSIVSINMEDHIRITEDSFHTNRYIT